MTSHNHGGKRAGAGAKTDNPRKNNFSCRFPDQIEDILNTYAKGTGLTKTQLVEMSIFNNLDHSNPNTIFCPECESPVAFRDIIQAEGMCEFVCKFCGKEFEEEI